jgi:general secretion pathway protein F
MRFIVRAINAQEQFIETELEANNEDEARSQIARQGWTISTIRLSQLKSISRSNFKKIFESKFSVLLFSQELLALINAGLALVESLEALLEKESHPQRRQILSSLLLALQEGKRFSQAVAEQNKIFSALYIGIVQASERTSSLPESLNRFIEYQQRVDIVRNKIISALIYPFILLTVGSMVSIFLIAYVVPRFAEVYQGTGRSLPWASQLLLDWGHFFSMHGKPILLLVSIGLVSLFILLKNIIRHGGWIEILGKISMLRPIMKTYSLSRVYLTLGMLLNGGIPVVTAISTVKQVVNLSLASSLQNALQLIESGITFSDAFLENGLTTPISQRLLRVGEKTGQLGEMLTQSAHFYDGEISRWIDRFIRMFEPILMAIIGIIVGAIVVLLYLPVFELADGFS